MNNGGGLGGRLGGLEARGGALCFVTSFCTLVLYARRQARRQSFVAADQWNGSCKANSRYVCAAATLCDLPPLGRSNPWPLFLGQYCSAFPGALTLVFPANFCHWTDTLPHIVLLSRQTVSTFERHRMYLAGPCSSTLKFHSQIAEVPFPNSYQTHS